MAYPGSICWRTLGERGRTKLDLPMGWRIRLLWSFWAGLQFDLLGGVSDSWLWPVWGGLTLINLAQTAWGFWDRRASNSGNPDRG